LSKSKLARFKQRYHRWPKAGMRIDVENGYWKIMVRTHESSGDQPVSLRFFLPSSLSPSSFFLHSPSSRPYLKIFRIFCRNSARRLERLRQKWKKQSVIRSQHSDLMAIWCISQHSKITSGFTQHRAASALSRKNYRDMKDCKRKLGKG